MSLSSVRKRAQAIEEEQQRQRRFDEVQDRQILLIARALTEVFQDLDVAPERVSVYQGLRGEFQSLMDEREAIEAERHAQQQGSTDEA